MVKDKISFIDFLKFELPDIILKASTEDVSKKYSNEDEDFRLGYIQGYLEGAVLVQRFVLGILEQNNQDMKLFSKRFKGEHKTP